MNPWWIKVLSGFAAEVLPDIWRAIWAGDVVKARKLVELAAQRRAEHLAAEKMLNELAERRGK